MSSTNSPSEKPSLSILSDGFFDEGMGNGLRPSPHPAASPEGAPQAEEDRRRSLEALHPLPHPPSPLPPQAAHLGPQPSPDQVQG